MKYYVVKNGRETGIFKKPWNEIKSLVDKYPGAIYKSFPTYEEANIYYNSNNPIVDIDNNFTVYTDGSCRNHKGGYGIVVIDGDNIREYEGSVPIYPCSNQKAELYAILMALKMVEKNKFTLITDSKYAIGCCSEWIDNWRKRDFEGIKNKELVIELDKHLNNKTIKFLHVYGHTGNKYNEICDMLAKKYT